MTTDDFYDGSWYVSQGQDIFGNEVLMLELPDKYLTLTKEQVEEVAHMLLRHAEEM